MKPQRRVWQWLVPAVLGLVVGCVVNGIGGGGCDPPPPAWNASAPSIQLQSHVSPCSPSNEAARGAAPHLRIQYTCPGTSRKFLIAVKIDGRSHALLEGESGGYSSLVSMDLGVWEPSDTLWHDVEVILDPLNLFHESDETDNRVATRLRIVEQEIEVGFFGFALVDGPNFGQPVTQVTSGTAVRIYLTPNASGSYPNVDVSLKFGNESLGAGTLNLKDCSLQPRSFGVRWTPPGPGVYDIEFRIDPNGPDLDPSNNVRTKRLVVTT